MASSWADPVIEAPILATPGWTSTVWRPLPGAAADDPDVCEIAFDASAFRSHAFDDYRLACPPTIARSVPQRQAEFFFGRLAARAALSALGLPPTDIPIGTLREPLWPAGVIGSVTHAAGRSAAVAMQRGARLGIGIDVERVIDDTLRPALLAGPIDAQELDLLLRLSGERPSLNALLTLVFSAKESLYKAAFGTVGCFFDHRAARLISLDLAEGQLLLEIREPLCPKLMQGTQCQLRHCFLDPNTVFTSFVW